MVTLSRLVAAIVVMSLPAGAAPVAPPVPVPSSTPPVAAAESPIAPAVAGLSDAQVAIVRHALGLYDEAGLVLPPVSINGRVDRSVCNGKLGIHRDRGGFSTIDLCTTAVGTVALRLVLHELAHAWVMANVGEETTTAFQQLRGWEYWWDYERADWADNGSEQAAEIVMWGLIDRPIRMTKIDDASCAALHTGFVLLTGRAPLHANSTWCDPVPHAGGPT
jgi:hypothetical protein